MRYHFKSPEDTSYRDMSRKTIFLAGSIEMGRAEDWQSICEMALAGETGYVTFNPRRKSWDSSWKQSIENKQFVEQVEWELDHLDSCDIIIMYLDENTTSPISLLELGLHAVSGKMRVVCGENFYRKGNVDIVCKRYNVPQYNSVSDLILALKEEV